MGTETFPPVRSRSYAGDVLDPTEVRGLFETANDVGPKKVYFVKEIQRVPYFYEYWQAVFPVVYNV